MRDTTGNLPPMPGVIPDYMAPIVRNAPEGVRELMKARWGMPSSQFALMQSAKKRATKIEAKGQKVDFKELLRMEPDGGTTKIRNVSSKHWQRWLGVEHRCVVPFTSFSEFNNAAGADIWFALDEERPLACFAGIWTNWTSVRKVKEGETTNDLFGFLTTEPNDVVGPIHSKAMPVILTKPEEIETWMTAGGGSAQAAAAIAGWSIGDRCARREERRAASVGLGSARGARICLAFDTEAPRHSLRRSC
jgi:putative SOS response-associated peptidase YedK